MTTPPLVIRDKRRDRVVQAAVIVLVLGACVWLWRQLDHRALTAALAGASLTLVALAAALNFLRFAFRTLSLRSLLCPVRVLPFGRLYRYHLSATAATALLPARAGEFLRVWLLTVRDGIPATTVVAVSLLDHLLDLLGLLVVALPLPLLITSLPRWIAHALWVLGGAAVLASGLVFFASRRTRGDAHGFFALLSSGLGAVRRPAALAAALAWALAAWATDALEVWLVLRAVGIQLPPAAPLLVLLAINMAIVVPSTPAQVGAFELGALAGLKVMGVPAEPALAFALLYHFMQVLPVSVAGFDGVRLARKARRQDSDLDSPLP